MGRAPCCDKANVKKGPWSPEEDSKLKDYIENFGTGGNWIALPPKAGLKRCGKSCRLRWLNYLRPNIKHGEFSDEEDKIICTLFATIGSRWSIIAAHLPGRTDNDIKNYWNTKLKKKIMGGVGILPSSHKKPPIIPFSLQSSNFYNNPTKSLIEPISVPSFTQTQENLVLHHPMDQYYFGSEAASCSPIVYGTRKIKHEEQMGFQSYFPNGFINGYGNPNPNPNGYCAETYLDYSDFEDVKQLMMINSNIFVDDNKK